MASTYRGGWRRRDQMRDVLDTFWGSGTTIIAAEKIGRRGVIEVDPKYVDVATKRCQEYTWSQAVHEVSGETFDASAIEVGPE